MDASVGPGAEDGGVEADDCANGEAGGGEGVVGVTGAVCEGSVEDLVGEVCSVDWLGCEGSPFLGLAGGWLLM